MGLIITATAGLSLWIVLWAIDEFTGMEGFIVAAVLVVIAVGIRALLPILPGRRD